MPFDSLKLHDSHTVILPPTPPEPGGGPRRRVVVNITIEQRQQSPRRCHRLGSFLGWLLLLILLASLAHADNGPHYEHWQDTSNGWHGQVRREGTTTDWDAYGPRGEQKHCHRYEVNGTGYTNCH